MLMMHASRSDKYRIPFGAMPTDSEVKLFFDCDKSAKSVTLCYTYGLYDMTYHEEPMKLSCQDANCDRYEITVKTPHEVGLVFYWFRFMAPAEDSEELLTQYYVADPDTTLCEGMVYFEPPHVGVEENKYPYAWQITVYDKDFVTPDKMKGAIVYQIFPDRFSRGETFDLSKIKDDPKHPERVFHRNWYEDVDIKGKPSTGYIACDFFAGSLNGILEKLGYIKSLGVDVIYLNPIFEARSSHRYDTADYLNVDPILGTNEDFVKLTQRADELGIKLVIDGVFSHTGADSKYFNKYGSFAETGAYESYASGKESKFRSWYSFFENEDKTIGYESWWGFPELPNVNENDLSYRKFVFGDDGIVDTWVSRGIGGIRLDVSDELPDSFIRQMRDTLKAKTKGEGILIGEVWEDASNKCSYGSYRDFLFGRTHDSVMGYTFREVVMDFLTGRITAKVADARLEGYRERYPQQAFYCIMNLISSHDVPRALTCLSGAKDAPTREEQQKIHVDSAVYDQAVKLMRMALALQVGYVGATSLYYGDEILMDGYKDPFNRRTYPWGNTSKAQEDELFFARQLLSLRSENDVLRTGFYKTLVADDDFWVFSRFSDDNCCDVFGKAIEKGSKEIVLFINRKDNSGMHVTVDDTSSISYEPLTSGAIDSQPYIVKANSDRMEIDVPPHSFVFLCY